MPLEGQPPEGGTESTGTTALTGGPVTDPAAAKPAAGTESGGTPEGDKGREPGTRSEDDAATSPDAPPEKYEFAAPEGVSLDSELLTDVESFARTHKLSKESAQAIADIGVRLTQKWTKAAQEAQAAQVQAWSDALPKDPEFGGEKLKENLGLAASGAKHCFTQEGIDFLDKSGLGNHPELVRAMFRVGKILAEDTLGKDNPEKPDRDTQPTFEQRAERLYGKQKTGK